MVECAAVPDVGVVGRLPSLYRELVAFFVWSCSSEGVAGIIRVHGTNRMSALRVPSKEGV